ncbi:MAG TPA: hypothetical protein VFU98_09240 [Microlunatus sp.]|nr:hypothetical protein [Microlunatus sp.]
MSTPAQWSELVTTALLGTDRRAVEEDLTVEGVDAPVVLLRQAARHRVLDRLAGPAAAGRPPADAAVPTPAPEQDRPEAPWRADQLLADLLRSPDPALVSCWLATCAAHRRTVSALHWTRLARLAARTAAYDRSALGQALGPRGRWFLRQNPEWRRLAADARRTPSPSTSARAAALAEPVTAAEVLADPDRIFAQPQPWTPDLVSAAYAVLGGEGGVPPGRAFPTRLGVAMPPALYPSIARAGEYYVLAPEASPGRRRTIRDRFVALELAAYARAAVDHAFGDTGTDFTRAEITHV